MGLSLGSSRAQSRVVGCLTTTKKGNQSSGGRKRNKKQTRKQERRAVKRERERERWRDWPANRVARIKSSSVRRGRSIPGRLYRVWPALCEPFRVRVQKGTFTGTPKYKQGRKNENSTRLALGQSLKLGKTRYV